MKDLDTITYEEIIELERKRQNDNIELIASENFPSQRILDAAGSILTNKYAEGYPEKRYYGGCEFIDMIEQKAINDACKLFKCNYANVQPHCGSSANQAVYRALLCKGDTVLGMDLGAGGHLTHGHKMSFSGQDYNIVSYGVDEEGKIDIEDFKEKLYKYEPHMIIVGASSYSQIIDYKVFSDILDDFINTKGYRPIYMVDAAHVAGLVAAGVHPNPCEYADVVTSTTHKTLRGPRGGLILTNDEEIIKKINKSIFPGMQGGPLMHVIGAKAQCFYEALQPEFKEYVKNIIKNANAMAEEFKKNGVKVISGGTDNHLMLIDVKTSFNLSGKEAEHILDSICITVNKNTIPFDTETPNVTSGLRIGTPAMTTRGLKEEDFREIADIIIKVLRNPGDKKLLKECKNEALAITKKYPLKNIK